MKRILDVKKFILFGILLVLAGGFLLHRFATKYVSKTGDLLIKKQVPLQDAEKKTSEVKRSFVKSKSSISKGVTEPSTLDIEKVSSKLKNPNVTARVQAVLSLREYPTKEAISLLRKFLKDNDEAVVSEAIDTLGVIALKNEDLKFDVLKILCRKAKDKKFIRRGQALLTAAIVGKEEVLSLVKSLISETDDTQNDFVARAFFIISDPSSVPYLTDLLSKSSDPGVHKTVYDTLARINTDESIKILKEAVITSQGENQMNSAMALALLNEPDANDFLACAIEADKLDINTVNNLAKTPAAPAIFAKVLEDSYLNKDKEIDILGILSKYAIYGTSEVRSGVISAIVPLMQSPDEDVQVEAIRTIGRLGGRKAADALIPMLRAENPKVREQAVLSFMAYVTPETYEPLLPLVWDKNKRIRRAALLLVERFLSLDDRDFLEKLATENEDKFIRERAKKLLAQMQQR